MQPPSHRGDYAVVIVSWNVRAWLERCLDSVHSAPTRPATTVVVDNASEDGTQAMLAARADVRAVLSPTNLGFSGGNNLGLRVLGVLPNGADPGQDSPFAVVLLNPDTEVRGDALGRLVAYLESHPRVGACGPELLWPDGTHQSSRRRFPSVASAIAESTPLEWHWRDNPWARRLRMADVPTDRAGEVDWVTGAAVACRADALAQVAGFDETFFMYSEELDLCRRLREAGWEVHYLPDAQVTHHEGKSSEQVVPERHVRFHRSRLRYFHKHHGAATALALRALLGAMFALELLIEGLKLLVGHKVDLRRQRMAAYARVIREAVLAP